MPTPTNPFLVPSAPQNPTCPWGKEVEQLEGGRPFLLPESSQQVLGWCDSTLLQVRKLKPSQLWPPNKRFLHHTFYLQTSQSLEAGSQEPQDNSPGAERSVMRMLNKDLNPEQRTSRNRAGHLGPPILPKAQPKPQASGNPIKQPALALSRNSSSLKQPYLASCVTQGIGVAQFPAPANLGEERSSKTQPFSSTRRVPGPGEFKIVQNSQSRPSMEHCLSQVWRHKMARTGLRNNS